jgi:putative tryptophan/tyrosine transport system substrate-binding protein
LTSAAQKTDRVRRLGWVETFRVRGPPNANNWTGVAEQLKSLGWTRGVNVSADLHIATTPAQLPRIAKEVVGTRPDLVVTNGSPATLAVLVETRTLPVLFFEIADPVANGLLTNLSRPGGNLTGFTTYEPSLAGKWVQLLKELDPHVRRIAVLFNPESAPNRSSPFLQEFEAAAISLGVQPILGFAQDTSGIEAVVASLAAEPGGALLVLPDDFTLSQRHSIVNFGARYRVLAIYGARFAAATGGLISYGPSAEGLDRGLASYIDKILRGTPPGELPIQAPPTYELVINLRTARALGISVPPAMLAAADTVIE